MQKPDWWDWELDLRLDHLREQMVRRQFSETDLREMFAHATAIEEDDEFGRWRVTATKDAATWEIIVEPQMQERVLLLITAYKIDPL